MMSLGPRMLCDGTESRHRHSGVLNISQWLVRTKMCWLCFLWNVKKLCFWLVFCDIEGCCRICNEVQVCSAWHVDDGRPGISYIMLMFPKFRRISMTSFVSIVHPVKFDNPWTFFRKNFIIWYNVTKFFTGFACHWRLNSWPKRFIFHDAHWQYYPCPVQIIRYLLNEERWEIRCPLPTTLSSLFTLTTFASNYLVNNCYSVWQEFWGE